MSYNSYIPTHPYLAVRIEEKTGFSMHNLLPCPAPDLCPTPTDWSVKEVVCHLSDSERIFSYRALRVARADPTPLPGFDQEPYVPASGADARPLADLLAEFAAVRQATLWLFRSLPTEAWTRRGIASDSPISVRALAYIIAGHENHHMRSLKEEYLLPPKD